jgi:hypothetical protein
MNRLMWVLIVGLLLGIRAEAVAQDDEDEVSAVQFLVLKDDNSKPVRNAGVVMHPVSKNGKQERGGIELKTDADGKASFDGVPYGKLRIQVLAQGFQTYGEDYQIDKPALEITVRLKRPQKQYSIYEQHPDEKKDEGPPPPPANDPKAKSK